MVPGLLVTIVRILGMTAKIGHFIFALILPSSNFIFSTVKLELVEENHVNRSLFSGLGKPAKAETLLLLLPKKEKL